MVKVSIIMPVYNKEKFIKKSIDSVLNQTYKDYELIIIDDGSKDETPRIIDEYSKNHQQISVTHIGNSGVSNARNIGIKQAHGQWIQFLDGDDFIDCNYLTNLSALINDNSVDIIFSNFEKIDENGNILERIFVNELGYKDAEYLVDDFVKYQYNNGFYGFISNKLIRKSIVDRSKIQFPNGIVLAEDLAFYVQLYQHVNRIYYFDTISFYYLQNSQNYSLDGNIDYISQAMIQLSIKNWFSSVNKSEYYDFINKKINDYACYAIFDGFERNLDINAILQKIRENKDIAKCLEYKYVSGINNIILYSILHDKYSLLLMAFRLRNVIRLIYRRIKQWKK